MTKLLFVALLSSALLTSLSSQNQEWEISDLSSKISSYDKVFEITIGNPMISIHFPTGAIFRDSSYANMSILNERELVLSNGTYGFQFTPIPPNYNRQDYKSITFSKRSSFYFNGSFFHSSIRRAYWGERSPGSFNFDFETFGNVSSVDFGLRKMSVLTQNGALGRVDVYNYSNVQTRYSGSTRVSRLV